MRVKSVTVVHHDEPVPVYDVVNVDRAHNFVVAGNRCNIVSHNCGFMDECNFSKAGVKDVNKAKRDMKDTYNTITARIKGTFRKNGEVCGKFFAVSSKKSDSDFLEDYVATQMRSGAGDHMYVDDKPQWEVLPKSMFNPSVFYIAVGDRHKRGFVVPDNQTSFDSLEELRQQGYKLLTPPLDMRPEFVADFDIALRDLAGISVPGALSFITQDVITECINSSRRNCFYNDILQIGVRDNYSIEEFFHFEEIEHLKHCPTYIHMDLSLNTDKSGLSGVCINGRRDITDIDGKTFSYPTFCHLFSVSLEAPRGDKIPYEKILTFLCWLRRKGLNIQIISRDQFQSEYMAQLLEAQGFTVNKISLDRTPDGYLALRSVLIEHRVDMLDCQLLQDELIHLQRDAVTGKVDHPVGGSKDSADSFAGAIWDAILDEKAVPVSVKKVANVIGAVNSAPRYNSSVKSGDLSSMFSSLYSNPQNKSTRKR